MKKNEGDPHKMLNVKFVQSDSIFAYFAKQKNMQVANICIHNKLDKQNFGTKVYFPEGLEDGPFQIQFFTWYFHKFL